MLTTLQQSQYGMPVIIIHKKEVTVRFITDYRYMNQEFVRKPYPLPKICDDVQQLGGFHYATPLDLNMGYYTIELTSVVT